MEGQNGDTKITAPTSTSMEHMEVDTKQGTKEAALYSRRCRNCKRTITAYAIADIDFEVDAMALGETISTRKPKPVLAMACIQSQEDSKIFMEIKTLSILIEIQYSKLKEKRDPETHNSQIT